MLIYKSKQLFLIALAICLIYSNIQISFAQSFMLAIPGSTEHKPLPEEDFASKFQIDNFEKSIYECLKIYSNVHRGSGLHSRLTEFLYEGIRQLVMSYFGIKKRYYKNYTVIFGDEKGIEMLGLNHTPKMGKTQYYKISTNELGLPFGVVAVVIHKKFLPEGAPAITGGGTLSEFGGGWASPPGKFEAGTPNIIGVIALAKALSMIDKLKNINLFKDITKNMTIDELFKDRSTRSKGRKLLDTLKEQLICEEEGDPYSEGLDSFINFDNAASAPTFKPIWETARRAMYLPEEMWLPLLDKVRRIAQKFYSAPAKEYSVCFYRNTTYAINYLVKSMEAYDFGDIEPVVVNSLLDHNSNELPWRESKKITNIRMDVDKKGFIDIKKLESLLQEYNEKYKHGKKRIKLIALSGASNIFGTVNDMKAAAKIAHQYGTEILVDAAQLAPHRAIDVKNWGVDYLAFSAHKMYAPFGSGGLVARKNSLYTKELRNYEEKLDNMNIVGVAALGKAMQLLQRIGMDVIEEDERKLTAYALEKMKNIKDIKIYGIDDPKRTSDRVGVITFNIGSMPDDIVSINISQVANIGFRAGVFCGDDLFLKKFHTMGALRISFGLYNTTEEIDIFIEALEEVVQPRANKGARRPHRNIREVIPILVNKIFTDTSDSTKQSKPTTKRPLVGANRKAKVINQAN